MLEWTKKEKGWIVEITSTVNDCLEQGGICGRKELYKNETLKKAGIDPVMDDPEDYWNDFIQIEDYLVEQIECDKVLRRGTIIQ